jgi:hypothetical protein
VQDYVSASQYGVGLTPDQTEHKALRFFFPVPEKSLDYSGNHHDYASYLFWLWAVRKGNDPTLVRQVWNAVASKKSLEAAKGLFGGGWPQAWKDFTKANWNKDPVGDYQDWDDIHDTPAVAAEGTLTNTSASFNVNVGPVAAKYLTFRPAGGVNVLTYKNVGTLSDEAGVQAIITYTDDTKTTEDWTQIAQQDVPFCNIKELTLVFSNASVTPGDSKLFQTAWSPPSSGPHSAVSARAANVCLPDPRGSFSGSSHYEDSFGTVLDWSWSGSVDFDPFGPFNPWFPAYAGEVWDSASVASGSVTMSASGSGEQSDGDPCTIDVPAATYQLNVGEGSMIVQPGPEPHYGIQLLFPSDEFPEGTLSCAGENPLDTLFPGPPWLIYTADPQQAAVRGTYQGSGSFPSSGFSSSFSWNLSDPLAPPSP